MAGCTNSIPSGNSALEYFLAALEASAPAEYFRGARWGYAALSAAHALGLALLVGAIVPLDLRLPGFWPDLEHPNIARVLVPVAAAGLALAVSTGSLLFSVRARVRRRAVPASEACARGGRHARGALRPRAPWRSPRRCIAGAAARARDRLAHLLARRPRRRTSDRFRRMTRTRCPVTHALRQTASIRCMISESSGPASAAATHSSISWRFLQPSTTVSTPSIESA